MRSTLLSVGDPVLFYVVRRCLLVGVCWLVLFVDVCGLVFGSYLFVVRSLWFVASCLRFVVCRLVVVRCLSCEFCVVCSCAVCRLLCFVCCLLCVV